MAVTPNYSWPVPVNTDYVKDGAEAIKDLGDAIDATVFGLPAPASGLTLINATTITAQPSLILSNIFTSTYSRYRIMFDCISSDANQIIALRFRENLTDKATGYQGGIGEVAYNAATTFTGLSSATYFNVMTNVNIAVPSIISLDLYRSATLGSITGSGFNDQSGKAMFIGGNQQSMTNFTGFSLFPANTGTITGSVKVYGYQES